MRKRLVTRTPTTVQARGEGWLDLEHAADLLTKFTIVVQPYYVRKNPAHLVADRALLLIAFFCRQRDQSSKIIQSMRVPEGHSVNRHQKSHVRSGLPEYFKGPKMGIRVVRYVGAGMPVSDRVVRVAISIISLSRTGVLKRRYQCFSRRS